MRRRRAGWRIDVEGEAILGHLLLPEAITRQARRPGLGGIADSLPGGRRLRRAKAQCAHRRRGERHAQEHPPLRAGNTADCAGIGLHYLGLRIGRVHQRRHLARAAWRARGQRAGRQQEDAEVSQLKHAQVCRVREESAIISTARVGQANVWLVGLRHEMAGYTCRRGLVRYRCLRRMCIYSRSPHARVLMHPPARGRWRRWRLVECGAMSAARAGGQSFIAAHEEPAIALAVTNAKPVSAAAPACPGTATKNPAV